jgi:acyl carrier protein
MKKSKEQNMGNASLSSLSSHHPSSPPAPSFEDCRHQNQNTVSSVSALDQLEKELARMFVEALNLEITPEAIDPTAPLYGDGLGLDSIDILEVALEVSRRYGFQLRSDDEKNHQIFQSLRNVAMHVATHRTQ